MCSCATRSTRRYGFAALSIPGYMNEVLDRYEATLMALRAQDEAKAEQVLKESLEKGGRQLARSLQRGGRR